MNSSITFSIENIIAEYAGYVFSIVDKISQQNLSFEDKEEITSEVFYLLWKNQKNIKGSLKSYVGAIARNSTYNHLRKVKPECELSDELLPKEWHINFEDGRDIMIEIKNGLLKFTAEEKEIFVLFYVEGYKIKEISQKLQKNSGAIKVKLFRIRQKLKEGLK